MQGSGVEGFRIQSSMGLEFRTEAYHGKGSGFKV